MQRKFLEDLGIDREIVDKIMTENGADINKTKESLNTQITELTEQLNTAKDTLKGFEGVDVTDLQGKITQLTDDLTAKDNEYQQKIADRDFNDKINVAITKAGGKNAKAVMALLDIDAIKASKNQDADIETALNACKTDNEYLFASAEPFQNPVGGTGGNPPAGDPLAAVKAAMGLKTEK